MPNLLSIEIEDIPLIDACDLSLFGFCDDDSTLFGTGVFATPFDFVCELLCFIFTCDADIGLDDLAGFPSLEHSKIS